MIKYKYENEEIFTMTKEGYCEACKGSMYMDETGCYEDCDGFYEAYQEILKEE